jgi:hypothetical protein
LLYPIFQWSVLFCNGKYKGILSNLGENVELSDTSLFISAEKNKYIFKEDAEIGEYYIRSGDEIRAEQISPEELTKMATLVKEKVKISPTTRITLFSWDKKFIDYYGNENLQNIYRLFN